MKSKVVSASLNCLFFWLFLFLWATDVFSYKEKPKKKINDSRGWKPGRKNYPDGLTHDDE